ncbi:TetR/AcrR family transcriptional regulator [Actinokineospora sp. HUAS TT18]|uniref:TetR/AcrR family transcriptional regulator n=1 Tax=Actinokineospora sp. HUAS TT18 TaxID=3447451 RepID=UPI003F527A22
MSSTGLPESIEAAWGLRERPNRGPKRGLTLEGIVAAGIAVADREGLPALSMSRVAAELGSSAMSLYRYISAKDELLALMIDAAYHPAPEPIEGDWRESLTKWAWAELTAVRSHPWVLRVPISGPPLMPNQLLWLESGLRALAHTPLGPGDKMSAILLVTSYVRAVATLAADIGTEHPTEAMPDYSAMLRRLITPESYPELTGILESGIFDQDDPIDDEFTFGLDRILDGIEALVDDRAK